ncbi:MAG: D-glycero-beta-D-manno-heptose-7-phosphate kinase [Acidobacteria bacterium]|nr:D-glycero-beta-D-manno-heptose-7-phosphate kinase [Acidobacteriota bacterium]
MTPQRAQDLIQRFASLHVLVAGDLMLDQFIWGNVSRISPEAPVPVVEVTSESFYAGGAANVARNLREFTPGVAVAGLIGADAPGRRLLDLLNGAGIDSSPILQDPALQTTVKTRVIARHQQVVRIDREAPLVPNAGQSAQLLSTLAARTPPYHAVILSDYAKGFLTPDLAAALTAQLPGCVVTVDPSPYNPLPWSGVTAVKPNLKEARAAAQLPQNASIEEIGAALLEKWGTAMVLVTLGENGMMLFDGAEPYHTPTRAHEVFDVSGAGDTAIAVFTLGLAAGATSREAAELANHASGIAVGKLGTATVSPEELLESLSGAAPQVRPPLNPEPPR